MSGSTQHGLWAKALGVSSALAVLSSAASDFLKPLFNSTLYLALFFLGLTLLAGAVQLFAGERRRAEIHRIQFLDIGKYWFGCLFTALVIFTGFLLITYTLNSDDRDGFLAENVPFIASLQKKWHMVETHLVHISENTRKTAEHAQAIEEHAKATEEHAGKSAELLEKMVNPLDARKQLAQLGLKYDVETYGEAVRTGDQEVIKLFFDAGMRPTPNTGDGSCAFFNAIVTRAPNWEKTLKLVVDTFKVNPNNVVPYSVFAKNKPHFDLINNWFTGNLHLPAALNNNVIQSRLGNINVDTDLGLLIAVSDIEVDKKGMDVIRGLRLNLDKGIQARNAVALIYQEHFDLINEGKGIPPGVEFEKVRDNIKAARKIWYTPERERDFWERLAVYKKATEELKTLSGQMKTAATEKDASEKNISPASQPSWKTQKSNPHIWRNK